jgi:type II secretory pathway pseudopilin PulG
VSSFRPRRPIAGGGARTGLTLLEVVLAVFMLTLAAAAVLQALAAIDASQARQQKQLAGMELANRLILTYLDSKKKMPSETVPLEYGPSLFYYELYEDQVRLEPANRDRRESASTGLDRYRQVTVVVYATDNNPRRPARTAQVAELSRVFDPFAPRNPDAMARLGSSPESINDMIRGLMGDDAPRRSRRDRDRDRDRGDTRR